VAFLMSGCASKNLYTNSSGFFNSGFFKDYEQLNKQIKPKASEVQSKHVAGLSTYKNIIIAPVKIISSIPKEQQTESQKNLYKSISGYLTSKYKVELANGLKYALVEEPSKSTLVLETAISAVEVHFDDASWYQFSSIPMGLTEVSSNIYMNKDVRILGEKRLVDSQTGAVLNRSMNIIRDATISVDSDNLEFKNIRPALDGWVEQLKKDFAK
jgi:ribosomal protein S17E